MTFGVVDAEQRLRELVDDARATEIRKGIVGGSRGDDRTVGQRVGGPVMVGDDDVEPQ